MHKQNLHTHTSFSDGADTPEEIIATAIEKNFDSVGFSEHSYMNYSAFFLKHGDKTQDYKKEILSLKEKYKNRIKIYLGLEVDMYSGPDMTGYDYLIGSMHYFKFQNEYVGFDRSQDEVANVIDQYFGGDGMKYVKAYYEGIARLPEYGRFDIIGHFDLITKHSDNCSFFDTSSKEYIKAAVEAAEALVGKIPLFEVNTGAVSRGYRKTPYPMKSIIKELKRLGFGAVITSDCHSKANLDCNFDEASALLKECGFKEKYILTDSGFTPVSL